MQTDYKSITVEIKDGVVVFFMNNPPVNQMSPGFSRELREAINGAFHDKDIKAVVLTGTGKNFIAGADITQLYAARERDTIHKHYPFP